MTLRGVTHVALRVEQLREAEQLYRGLFDLDVAFREVETPQGWQTLAPTAGWEDTAAAGIEPGLVMLHRDGFRLALEAVSDASAPGRLSHVGLEVDRETLADLRRASADRDCDIVVDREHALVFDDPLGVRWEINDFPYDDPPALSSGARTGAWFAPSEVSA